MKEVRRVVKGVTLIAKEIARRSSPNRNLQSFVYKALISATDLSGLTRGSLHRFTNNPNPNPCNPIPHVPFPDDLQNRNQPQPQPPPQPPPEQGQNQPQNHQVEHQNQQHQNHEPENQTQTQTLPPDKDNDNANDNDIGKLKFRNENGSRRRPRERRVPSTPFTRALGFAGLGAGLAWGTLQESAKRLVFGTTSSSSDHHPISSPYLSPQNAQRLALALCRMRGAALKIGQMLSIQDESLVPPPVLAALDIVRQGADVMPRGQLNQVLESELGPHWSSSLLSFDYQPIAAASIGQVHRAVTKDGMDVAMKIQYPGVADSIESDIENVKLLLDYTNLIPKGLYLDRAMKVAKEELSRECDYELEAANQKRFRDLLSNTQGFYVPLLVDDISSKRVLTTELISGIPIDKVALLCQETRNYVGKKLLELTLMELFVFRFMQTDPNWSNFLYDEATKTINLIDFGAARDYPKRFVDDYLRMVLACANGDRAAVIEMSQRLGFLTGLESEIMLEAHVQAGFVVGLPFSRLGGYDFRSTNITQSISNLGATMLKHRLTPPPDEVYSLHRKLSGAFLACIKLGAVVPCRELLLRMYEQYQFGEEGDEMPSSGSIS